MGTISDIAGRDARSLGQGLLSLGVVAEAGVPAKSRSQTSDPELDQRNKDYVLTNISKGYYMPIDKHHVTNYDDLVRKAQSEGFSRVNLVLKTTTINNKTFPPIGSDGLILSSGGGEATVAVNEAALKPTPEFVRDYTKHQIKNGRFIELRPEMAGNYRAMEQAATDKGFSKPPRVVLDTFADAAMSVSALPDGVPLVRVNPSGHEWTSQFTREYIMLRDSDIARQIEVGRLVDATGKMDTSVLQSVKESAARRGLTNVGVFVDATSSHEFISAHPHETKEGTQLVTVTKGVLGIKPEQQRAILEHELAHLQLGHENAAGIAKRYNQTKEDNGYLRAIEEQADKVGVCHAENPAVTAKHLADALASGKKIVKKMDKKGDTHPPIDHRIKNIPSYSTNCDDIAPLATPAAPKGATPSLHK